MSTWMFPSLAEALAGLLPREEKSVIVSSNSWDVRYSVTTLAISGFRPFTIENTGGWVSGGSPAIVSGFGGALIRDIGVDQKAFWVATDNSGLNHHNFVWYHNRTTQQVVDLVKQTGFRLVHLATEFGTAQTGDTSCVILQENPSRLNWWWFADSDFNDIDQFANASHMRVICVARIHS